MEREKKAEITAAEIRPADLHHETVASRHPAEVARSAAVVIGGEALVAPRGRKYRVKDFPLERLRQQQVDSGERRVARRQEDQRHAARLQNARDGLERGPGVADVLEKRLANHQVGIGAAPVTGDIRADLFVVDSGGRGLQFLRVNIESYQAQPE